MGVPDFQSLMLPLLTFAGDNLPHTRAEAAEYLANHFGLSEEERNEIIPSGQVRLVNRIGWTATYLRKAGLLQAHGPRQFKLTERGANLLAQRPPSIDVKFLETHYPEIAEFRKNRAKRPDDDEGSLSEYDSSLGKWKLRPQVQERIVRSLKALFPEEGTLQAVSDFLAFALENADEERSSGWYLREGDRGLRLTAGRLLACEITAQQIRASVMGPLSDETRLSLSIESDDRQFKHVPGGIIVSFPVQNATKALPLLRDSFARFIDEAMARIRRNVSLDDHCPEAVQALSEIVGRELPQPTPSAANDDPADDLLTLENHDEGARKASVRGRAPIFELGQRSIASLMSDIENEIIALPDLQRPFVWEDTKVRDLLDSLYLGFPVGTLVFWHTANGRDARGIGADRPGVRATALVIDGQQRLTSLYALIRGVEVVGKDGEPRKVTIAFRPRDGQFEVADAAIRRDPEYLPNIAELWEGRRLTSQIRRDLITNLRDRGRVVDTEYEDAVDRNLGRAHAITDYRFPTVDIRKTAASADEEVTDEDVAEIFVRINNQGTRLGQADFVLTLLSVFHPELRDRIEERARAMSQGAVVETDPQQLLRVACGVAFGRAKMAALYRYLRGVDPTTGEADQDARVERLTMLDQAADECMELNPWRDYLLRVQHAGFVNSSLIASRNAIINGYAFYIMGRKAGVPKTKLDEAISRWVFGSLLTARYSSASETTFEEDLSRIGRVADDPEALSELLMSP